MAHDDECKMSTASWGKNHRRAAPLLIVDTVHPILLDPPTITEKIERLGSFAIVLLSWWINMVAAVVTKNRQ